MIYVGIDDTDTSDSPGTNKIARSILGELAADYPSRLVIRHQLLFDTRIPYTSKNSSASLLFAGPERGSVEDLFARLRRAMLDRFVEGSDPGLCVAEHVPAEVIEFGQRCQREVVRQEDARRLAAAWEIRLEGLGGTEDGVIGALAAVGLAAGGNDGRVVSIAGQPDDLIGLQDADLLYQRGVDEIRDLQSHQIIRDGVVDIGKRLRPSYRNGKIVLLVAKTTEHWQAVRFP